MDARFLVPHEFTIEDSMVFIAYMEEEKALVVSSTVFIKIVTIHTKEIHEQVVTNTFQCESYLVVMFHPYSQSNFYSYVDDHFAMNGPSLWVKQSLLPCECGEHLQQITQPFIDLMCQW
jgi:hypothetical protein